MLVMMVFCAGVAGCSSSGSTAASTSSGGSSGDSSSTTGITSDTGIAGPTPSTTTIVHYDGFPSTLAQPTATLVADGSYAMSTSANTNFPSGDFTIVATFNEQMLSDDQVKTMNLTCVGSSSDYVHSTAYSSTTTLSIGITSLPAGADCTLTLPAPSGIEDVRDYAHNPFPGAEYPISTACSINDSFVNLSCWTALNSGTGTFSASSGTLTFNMPTGNSAILSGAPAIRKTGLAFKTTGGTYVPFIQPTIVVSSFTNFPAASSTDLVGVRVVDGANYFACTVGNGKLVETDSSTGSTTASFTVPSGSIHIVPSIYGSGGFFSTSECKIVDDSANELAKITVNYLSGQTNLSLDILGVGNASSGAIGAEMTSYNPINMVTQ